MLAPRRPIGLTLFLLGACLIPALTAPAGAAEPEDEVNVLIAFSNRPGQLERNIVHSEGGWVRRSFECVPAVSARLSRRSLARLQFTPGVLLVEPDLPVFAHDAELDNTWGVKKIGGGEVHAAGQKGTGVKVAIIDTGIDYTHPDLAANYAGGYDFVNDDDDPYDDNSHGTHVAGTVGAVDDDSGVVGVAPEVELYALKVLDENGSGTFGDVIAAVDWCIANGIQVTNNSYGSSGDPGQIVEAAFDRAYAAGIISIASAGNSGNSDGTGNNVGYPARYDSVVAIAATTSSDTRSSFSSTGPTVELAAPGSSVRSTVPGGGYSNYSGTSMASPHVAGAAALLIGAGISDTNDNGYINDEIRDLLALTAVDLGATGADDLFGFGRIDVALAVSMIAGSSTPPEEPVDPPSTGTVSIDRIRYKEKGKRDQNLVVIIDVVDDNGAPVAGAEIAFELHNDDTSETIPVVTTTNDSGSTRYKIRKADSGNWSTTVTSITAAGLTWDNVTPSNSYRK